MVSISINMSAYYVPIYLYTLCVPMYIYIYIYSPNLKTDLEPERGPFKGGRWAFEERTLVRLVGRWAPEFLGSRRILGLRRLQSV